MNRLFLVLLCGSGLLVYSLPAPGPALPDISGLVRLDGRTSLVIVDAKGAGSDVTRLGLLEVTSPNPERSNGNGNSRPPVVRFSPLPIEDLPAGLDPPNDLEAGCLAAGSPEWLLLAEGGYYKGRFGRIFICRISRGEDAGWRVSYHNHFHPFAPDAVADNQPFTSPGEVNIEGMASVACPERGALLVLSWRGGRNGGLYRPARLIWGRLAPDAPRPFAPLGGADLTRPNFRLGDRGCADLMVRPISKGWEVLAVATDDGGDHGPFRSTIYRAGELRLDREAGLRFRRQKPRPLWTIDGVKVEAIAPPPDGTPGAALCVGADDELYGGLWRLLFPPLQ